MNDNRPAAEAAPRPGPLPDLTDDFDLHSGNEFPYATIGEWVLLSEVSDRAKLVYCLLRMHCNRARGDHRAWPAQKTLADMLGLKKADTVSESIKELVKLGAVTVKTVRHARGRRNVYAVQEAYPVGYDGLASVQQFYEREHAAQKGSPVDRGYPRIGGDGSPVDRGENQTKLEPPELEPSSKQALMDSPSQAKAASADLPRQNPNGQQKIKPGLDERGLRTHPPRRSRPGYVPEPPPGLDEEELLDWVDGQVGGLAGHERNAAQSMIYYDVPPRKIVYTILKQREVGYV